MAIKQIYTIIGYTHEDRRDQWTTYGACTTAAAARDRMEAIATDALAGYHALAQDIPSEYGDMADSYLRYSPSYFVVPYVEIIKTDKEQKHLHLQVNTTTLRSGKDGEL